MARFIREHAALTRQMNTWRFVFLTAFVAACLAVLGASAQTSRFPPPDRPVAPIVTPTYSSEATRDEHGEAERVLSRLSVKPGMRVADVGAGDGYYTVRLANRLGPGATIYAEDVAQAHIDR